MKKISILAFFLVVVTQTNQESFIVKKPTIKKESRTTSLEKYAQELLEITDVIAECTKIQAEMLKEVSLDGKSLMYEDKKSFFWQADRTNISNCHSLLVKFKKECYQSLEKSKTILNEYRSLKSLKKC